MYRFITAIGIVAMLTASGCAKAPIVKRTAPGYFVGFTPLSEGDGRLLLYRPAVFFGDGAEVRFDVQNCEFSLGVKQFAVCRVTPGDVTITMWNSITNIDVPDSEWICVRLKLGEREFYPKTDCRALMDRLGVHRQVWTTQIPRDEILKKEIVGRDSRSQVKRRYPKGK